MNGLSRPGFRTWCQLVALFSAAVFGTACSSNKDDSGGVANWGNLPEPTDLDPELAPLPRRQAAYQELCSRGHDDAFARVLCASAQPPEIGNLKELLDLIGLGENDERAFALTANSTSVVSQHVSAINPRIIVFPRVGTDLVRREEMTVFGFVRGEQFVELVSRDLSTGQLTFYLLTFEQACNYESPGCDLASLLTEEIEQNWTAYSVYDQSDLQATSLDCITCHQPEGHGTGLILRMQELESPWLHWFPQRFGQRTESDKILTAQFAQAHQLDANYGGIPVSLITNAINEGSGAQLEAFIRSEGFSEQPNPFDGQIAAEARQGDSPSWSTRFAAHLEGHAIAVPYPTVDVTDAAKREAAVQSYLSVVQNNAPRSSLLDLRDVFSEDAVQKLSFTPWDSSDGRVVLTQMCAQCHDGRGDPRFAKNRFNILELDSMTREMKDNAIKRINANGPLKMPPPRSGRLNAEATQAAVAELSK